jgi:hypothetical protein
MRILMSILCLLSFAVLAEEAPSLITEMPTSNSISAEAPKWSFLIGQSNYNNDGGGAIMLGIERTFGEMFGVGFNYANFKNISYVDTDYAFNSYGENMMADLFVSPIRYKVGTVTFVGSAIFGTMYSTYAGTEGFYGAALNLNISNQIGFRLDTKSIANSSSMINTVSAVGYF